MILWGMIRIFLSLFLLCIISGCSESPTSIDNVNSKNQLATKVQVPEILYSDDPETLFEIAEQATLFSSFSEMTTTHTGWVKKMHRAPFFCATGMSESEIKSQNKVFDEFNKNNENISVLAYFKDGQKHNEYTEWYKFGKSKFRQEYYKDGKRHGTFTLWFHNGQKREEITYKYNRVDGKETFWHRNGQKDEEANYKDGKKDGLQTIWYENGQKNWEANYKNGKQDGLSTSWYKNGQKEEEANYKDGKRMNAKVWMPDGKECPESKVIDGNGTLVYYSLEGKEISRRNFKDGIRSN